jgi:DNA-binding response OmpR family regulator
MARKPRILIVEDEPAIRTGLIDVFVYHGFDVDHAVDGPSGLAKALTGKFDLVLLDVMLPGKNGFELCEAIRAADREQAIMMLTAKGGDEDIIQGLTLGADDYIAKPFSVAQLVLRVQAVLRRARVGGDSAGAIRLADSGTIDPANLAGRIHGREVVFTRREMDVLQYLARHAERAVGRDELLTKVWGYARGLEIETRTVDIDVAKLLRKIVADP